MRTIDSSTLLQASPAEMGFCPGCSHSRVLECLGKAFERISLGPERVCIVSDIGCIGISDRYFTCHTFHGLHGRSVTYAEGIKRARPELTVVVLIGDGGCGIGTGHLVHAARRGVDITVLACNNFNFGMTGGQHSPTTPPCGLTVTTPDGATEHVLDICGTVAANGGSYVARGSAFDVDCIDLIETAIRTPGFALIDIWELCVAYYVAPNKLNAPSLHELSETLKLPFGVMANAPRPNATAPPDLQPVHSSPTPSAPVTALDGAGIKWMNRTEIIMAGSAGQRIRSACGVLGTLATSSGSYAAQLDDFPITVRKGFSVSNLILSAEPIRYASVDDPDLIVLLSADGLGRIRNSEIAPHCHIYAEESLTIEFKVETVRRFSLRSVERSAGKTGASLAVLCQAIFERKWVVGEAFLEFARGSLHGAHRDDQLRAIAWAVEQSACDQNTKV